MSEEKKANPQGPPTKYNDNVPEQLLEYFKEIVPIEILGVTYPRINSIEGFSASIGIAKSTFYQWVKIHDDLSNAWERAKDSRADQLYQLTANKIISEGYGKMLTVNCTDMKDKVESTVAQTSTVTLAYSEN
jgi:hypothetical protein